MTLGALNVLGQNPDGFFLIAEGGGTAVRAADHQPGRMVEEEISFHCMIDGPVWTALTDHGPGMLPGLQLHSTHHTNSLVQVLAKGDAGRLLRTMVVGTDPVHGAYVDNTAIHRFLLEAAGVR